MVVELVLIEHYNDVAKDLQHQVKMRYFPNNYMAKQGAVLQYNISQFKIIFNIYTVFYVKVLSRCI